VWVYVIKLDGMQELSRRKGFGLVEEAFPPVCVVRSHLPRGCEIPSQGCVVLWRTDPSQVTRLHKCNPNPVH